MVDVFLDFLVFYRVLGFHWFTCMATATKLCGDVVHPFRFIRSGKGATTGFIREYFGRVAILL